jgi:outer membrane protein assembly factor BamD
MKSIVRLFAIVFVQLILCSCATQQHTEDSLTTYQKAVDKYEKRSYYDARKLFLEAIPLVKGKKEMIAAQFYLAYCYFHDKEYEKSANQFAEFYETYPRIPEAEEAAYMQGYSMYLDTPPSSLDADQTERTIKVLQQYVQRARSQLFKGTYQTQAQQYIQELQEKLARKAFDSGKLYYKLGYYKATLLTINNFQKTYPSSAYYEEASYIKVKAQYQLAKSATEDILNNWKLVIQYYYELVDQYPESKYAKEVQAIHEDALKKKK